MAGLNVNRIVEAVYPAWNSGETRIHIPLVTVKHTFSFSKSVVDIPKVGDAAHMTVHQTTVKLDWSTHSFYPTQMAGRVNFAIILNGWPTGNIIVPYTSFISVMSEDAENKSHVSQLMLDIIRDMAQTLVQHEDLAKFVEPSPIKVEKTPQVDKWIEGFINSHINSIWKPKEDIQTSLNDAAEHMKNYYAKIKEEMLKNSDKADKEKKHILFAKATPLQQSPTEKQWNGQVVESRAQRAFPALKTMVRCPECNDEWLLIKLIQHLNDDIHNWARTASEAKEGQPNIADWLEEWSIKTGISLEMRDDSDVRQDY